MYKPQIKSLVEYIDVSGMSSSLTGTTNCYAYQGYITFIKKSIRRIVGTERLSFAIRQSPFFILSELVHKQECLQPYPAAEDSAAPHSVQLIQCHKVIHEFHRVINMVKRCVIRGSYCQTPDGKFLTFTEENAGLCIRNRAIDILHYALSYYARYGIEQYYNQLIILNSYCELKKELCYFFEEGNHELPVIVPDISLNPFHRFRLNGADVDFSRDRLHFDRQVCTKCLTKKPEGCCYNPRLVNTDYAFLHENKCYLVPAESLALSSDGKTASLQESSLIKYVVPEHMFFRH